MSTRTQHPLSISPDSASYLEDAVAKTVSMRLEFASLNCAVELQYFADAPASHRLSVRIEYSKRPHSSQMDLVVRYSSKIASGHRFFTDSNGLLSKERDFGELSPFVECNYFPVTKFVGVSDSCRWLTLIRTCRSEPQARTLDKSKSCSRDTLSPTTTKERRSTAMKTSTC